MTTDRNHSPSGLSQKKKKKKGGGGRERKDREGRGGRGRNEVYILTHDSLFLHHYAVFITATCKSKTRTGSTDPTDSRGFRSAGKLRICFSDIPRKISFLLIVSIWALYPVLTSQYGRGNMMC